MVPGGVRPGVWRAPRGPGPRPGVRSGAPAHGPFGSRRPPARATGRHGRGIRGGVRCRPRALGLLRWNLPGEGRTDPYPGRATRHRPRGVRARRPAPGAHALPNSTRPRRGGPRLHPTAGGGGLRLSLRHGRFGRDDRIPRAGRRLFARGSDLLLPRVGGGPPDHHPGVGLWSDQRPGREPRGAGRRGATRPRGRGVDRPRCGTRGVLRTQHGCRFSRRALGGGARHRPPTLRDLDQLGRTGRLLDRAGAQRPQLGLRRCGRDGGHRVGSGRRRGSHGRRSRRDAHRRLSGVEPVCARVRGHLPRAGRLDDRLRGRMERPRGRGRGHRRWRQRSVPPAALPALTARARRSQRVRRPRTPRRRGGRRPGHRVLGPGRRNERHLRWDERGRAPLGGVGGPDEPGGRDAAGIPQSRPLPRTRRRGLSRHHSRGTTAVTTPVPGGTPAPAGAARTGRGSSPHCGRRLHPPERRP